MLHKLRGWFSRNRTDKKEEINSKVIKEIYFKVTNEEEKHYGYQYKDGLNVLDKEFEHEGSCVAGGLYFTDFLNIKNFLHFGVNLRIVKLPKHNLDFKMVKDPVTKDGNKWRANMIVLGEKYSLYDIDTYKKFNLNILKSDIIAKLCSKRDIDGLNKLYDFCCERKVDFNRFELTNVINDASTKGYVDVLEWLEKIIPNLHNIRGCYSDKAGDINDNYINVLNWWLKMHLQTHGENKNVMNIIHFPDLSFCGLIIKASTNGWIDILNWFLNIQIKHGIHFPYVHGIISKLCEKGRVDVLEWFYKAHTDHNLQFDDHNLFQNACTNKHINVVKWWLDKMVEAKTDNKKLKLSYASNCIKEACDIGCIEILDLFLEYHVKHGITMPYDHNVLDNVHIYGNMHILNWWLDIHIKHNIKFPSWFHTIDKLSKDGNIDVLTWRLKIYEEHQIPFEYSDNATHDALMYSNIYMLNWWINTCKKYKFKFKLTERCITELGNMGNIHSLEWLLTIHAVKFEHFERLRNFHYLHKSVAKWLIDNKERIDAIKTDDQMDV